MAGATVASVALLSELDAIEGWSPERWGQILHRIANLFISRADGLATRQIELFDDVFVRLIDRADRPSLIKLSQSLSETKRPLPRAFRRLALEADESISGPILRSGGVAHELLLEVARAGGLKHLAAIAVDILSIRLWARFWCNAETREFITRLSEIVALACLNPNGLGWFNSQTAIPASRKNSVVDRTFQTPSNRGFESSWRMRRCARSMPGLASCEIRLKPLSQPQTRLKYCATLSRQIT